VIVMHAELGDWLIIPAGPGHPHERRGQVVGLLHPDGSPPYRVRWLDDDHLSVLYPPPDTRCRARSAAPAGRSDAGGGRHAT